MKNLILTIMHGYDYPFVQPFLKSLKSIQFNGDLIIFVSNTVSRATKSALIRNGATLIEYNATYPFIPSYAEEFEDIVPDISISNYRFLLYLKYLTDHTEVYDKILLTDIRDVIFQSDPFQKLEKNGIYVFLEDAVQTFRESKLNYNWCAAANGYEFAEKVIDKVVSCAGVTIGHTAYILNYLRYMKGKLKNRKELPWAFDQGIHNGFVYGLRSPGTVIIDNDAGFVATLGAYQPYLSNERAEVINSQGKPFSIVHQYDRSGELMTKIKSKYIGNRLLQKFYRLYYAICP